VVADVSVEVGPYLFRGPFVVAEADYGILGRNILNLLLLTLDGPRLLWPEYWRMYTMDFRQNAARCGQKVT